MAGLCWISKSPGSRRPKSRGQRFPSWLWTGWQGCIICFRSITPDNFCPQHHFPKEVTVMFEDDTEKEKPAALPSPRALSWSEYVRLGKKEKEFILRQDHSLQITAYAISFTLRQVGRHKRWVATALVGNKVLQGRFYPTKDEIDGNAGAEFGRRLCEEPWHGIILTFTEPSENIDATFFVLVLEKGKGSRGRRQEVCWERVGLAEIRYPGDPELLEDMLERRTILLG